MHLQMRPHLVALALALHSAAALPKWSWERVPTFFHCANLSGAWSDAAVARIAKASFAVFEKNQGLFAPPVNTSAETKIVNACRQVKAVSPTTDCYMCEERCEDAVSRSTNSAHPPLTAPRYTESDWARTYYTLGHVFDAHPEWELHADALPHAPLTNTTDYDVDENGVSHTFYFRAYDFSVAAARAAWVARVTDAVAASGGALDGAFIDGNRGGWRSGILSGTTPQHAAAWAAGLNASHRALAAALGPRHTLISNYATDEALAVVNGGMMERGGSSLNDIRELQSLGTSQCGLFSTPCVADYHAQYAERDPATFAATLASFLIGAGEYAFYGRGGGWNGVGADACSTWLEWPLEYDKPLGAPAGPAKEGPTGTFARVFATGTHAWVDTSKGGGHCIWWADGSSTGDLTHCPPKLTALAAAIET